MRSPIGIRIRRKRVAEGLSQTALARSLGISASYLNLIENNKRAIGGSLLIRIAERLGMDLDLLSGESEARSISTISEMMSDPALKGIEIPGEEIRELVARFPDAALALVKLYRSHIDATAEIESLNHRLRSDPLLADLLHEMLNLVAGMKSGTEILTGIPDLTEAERARFHVTINTEAQELAATARNLVAYFERSPSRQRAVSPLTDLDEAFIVNGNHFPLLEDVADAMRKEITVAGKRPLDEAKLTEAMAQRFAIAVRPLPSPMAQERFRYDAATRTLWFSALSTPSTRIFQAARLYAEHAAAAAVDEVAATLELTFEETLPLARRALSSYVAGAMMMPYGRFLAEAEELRYDVDLLTHRYGASYEQAAHRLVTLRRRGQEGVPFGFLRADTTGRLTKRFPLPGLVLPASGHGCLLWPLYDAFAQDGVVRQVSEFSGGNFLLMAKAEAKGATGYGVKPLTYSIMLACDVLHADRTVYGQGIDLHHEPVPVGPSCLLCSRHQCAYRQERPA